MKLPMRCQNCGEEGTGNFCKRCGAPLMPEENENTGNLSAVPDMHMPPQNGKITEDMLPYELKPISMWGYFGYSLLFMIPLVGFILMLIFALGGTSNVNLRNYARSQFCVWIILLILGFVLGIIPGLLMLASYAF